MATRIVSLSPEYLFAYANDKVMVKKQSIAPIVQERNKYVVGRQYYLHDGDFDESEEERDIYELVKVIKEVKGISFDSLVMKPIRVKSIAFTLNKRDCRTLGVNYQENLLLFPSSMDWRVIEAEVEEEEEDREFNANDLSTYPVDIETKTIRKMLIRLVGFTQTDNGIIVTPSGYHTPIPEFLSSIKINIKPNVIPNRTQVNCQNIPWRSVTLNEPQTRNITLRGHVYGMAETAPLVDNSTHSIFMEIDLTQVDMSTDERHGIIPSVFANKSINDIITVTWEERTTEFREIRPHTTRGLRYGETPNNSPRVGYIDLDERELFKLLSDSYGEWNTTPIQRHNTSHYYGNS